MTVSPPAITHYVSVDLGSDSMAAFAEELGSGQGHLVPLQESAETYEHGSSFDLLKEGQALSKRLPTRIYLRDPVKFVQLPADHADARFIGPDGRHRRGDADFSLYMFFAAVDTNNPIMPNPKLIFQTGCRKAIPDLTLDPPPGRVRFDPAVLLLHLTVHLINNLVLTSSVLRNVLPQQIHLVLTIPNVYSITHSRQLESFVRAHTSVGNVSVVYESDALAYYVLDPQASPHTVHFRKNVMKPEERDGALIVTIDIGRGTTDLSLIRMETATANSRQEQHTVLARTGVCSGGQELTYRFVEYFNETVTDAFNAAGIAMPYDFISDSPQNRFDQRLTNRALEKYIEMLKRSVDKNYKLPAPPVPESPSDAPVDEWAVAEATLIDDVVEKVLVKIAPNNRDPLRDALRAALRLPRDLRNPAGKRSKWRSAWNWLRRKPTAPDPRFAHVANLVRAIEAHVRKNVDEMLSYLEPIAEERERQQLSKPMSHTRSLLEENDTFVVVAGQAAQFQPIRRAIQRWFHGKVPKNCLHFVEDANSMDESKVACCKGAVSFLKTRPAELNVDEFFGTYGFCRSMYTMKTKPFVPANTAELVRDSRTTMKELTRSLHYFVYVVRPISDSFEDGYVPELMDGYTSFLCDMQDPPNPVVIEYDRANQRLVVDGRSIDAVTSHGQVNAEIQPKVWPIIVQADQ